MSDAGPESVKILSWLDLSVRLYITYIDLIVTSLGCSRVSSETSCTVDLSVSFCQQIICLLGFVKTIHIVIMLGICVAVLRMFEHEMKYSAG